MALEIWIGDKKVVTKEWWDTVIHSTVPVTRAELREYLRVMERMRDIPIKVIDISAQIQPHNWRAFLDAWIKGMYRGSDNIPIDLLGSVIPGDATRIAEYMVTEAIKKYNRPIRPNMQLHFGNPPPRVPNQNPLPNWKDLLEQNLGRPIEGPKFNRTPIQAPSPPAEEVIMQYIGGPKNAEQEYLTWAEHPQLQQGAMWMVKLDAPPARFDGDNLIPPPAGEIAVYKLTFIPMAETPFSDAQIVVGIFQ